MSNKNPSFSTMLPLQKPHLVFLLNPHDYVYAKTQGYSHKTESDGHYLSAI